MKDIKKKLKINKKFYGSYLYVCISYLSEGPARAGAGGGGGGY